MGRILNKHFYFLSLAVVAPRRQLPEAIAVRVEDDYQDRLVPTGQNSPPARHRHRHRRRHRPGPNGRNNYDSSPPMDRVSGLRPKSLLFSSLLGLFVLLSGVL